MGIIHESNQAIVLEAKKMLAEDRERYPDRDPFAILNEIAEGLSEDLKTSLMVQMRGDLYREGLRVIQPPTPRR